MPVDALTVSHVSRETIELCGQLEREARKWQRTTNLVAPSTLNDFWHRHIEDSLQLVPLIPYGSKIVDLGSGGGFPALPLATWQAMEGGGSVTAIESNRKKTAFLRQTAHKLGVAHSFNVISQRIENVDTGQAPADIISARALASLAALLELVWPWQKENPKLKLLFHKGREYQAELDACRGGWAFDLVEHQSVTNPDARVLEISKLTRKADHVL